MFKTVKNVVEAPEPPEDSSTEDEDEHSFKIEDVKRVDNKSNLEPS